MKKGFFRKGFFKVNIPSFDDRKSCSITNIFMLNTAICHGSITGGVIKLTFSTMVFNIGSSLVN